MVVQISSKAAMSSCRRLLWAGNPFKNAYLNHKHPLKKNILKTFKNLQETLRNGHVWLRYVVFGRVSCHDLSPKLRDRLMCQGVVVHAERLRQLEDFRPVLALWGHFEP